jgi:hypothetical protein
MILYANGDSHCFGTGLSDYQTQRFIQLLADKFNLKLVAEPEPGGSLDRALRSSYNYIENNNQDLFVLFGIPSLEREEREYDKKYFQFNVHKNTGQHHQYPAELQEDYIKWLSNYSNDFNWAEQIEKSYHKINSFHQYLKSKQIKHLFFNTAQSFVPNVEFGDNFVHPYNREFTFIKWCQNQNFKGVDNYNHYGLDAHKAWADFLEPYIRKLI